MKINYRNLIEQSLFVSIIGMALAIAIPTGSDIGFVLGFFLGALITFLCLMIPIKPSNIFL